MNQRVLIIDDDVTFCEALARALQRRGFVVQIAHNAEQACLAADQYQPEYAVVDLRIGEDSGLKVVQTLHAKYSELKMVVLTGFASIATAVEAIKLGAIQYLTKPADADDIVAALQQQDANSEIEITEKPMSVRRLEWEHIQSVLAQHNGNISATARALGIHRRSLQRKLQKHPVRE